MTAITLNLLGEEQLAQSAKGRDPVKMAVGVGAIILSLAVASGTIVNMLAAQHKSEADALQARWDAMGGDKGATSDNGFQALKTLVDDLTAMNQGHAMFAPQLALIKDIVPESILLTRLSLVVNVEAQQIPLTELPGDAGKPKTQGPMTKPKPPPGPKNVERLVLQLEGKILSTRPEIEADNFIRTLREHPALGSQLKTVQLRSIARPQNLDARAGAAVPAAAFVIECQYKERS